MTIRRDHRDRGDGRARQGGMVTAELAAAIPALLIVLGLTLAAVSAGREALACGEVARLAARHLARGEPPGQVRQVAAARLPSGAVLAIEVAGDLGQIQVSHPDGVWLLGLRIPGCRASATVEIEQAAES